MIEVYDIIRNEPMKDHTTMGIGGPAHYFCEPKNMEKMVETLNFAIKENLRTMVIGNGSNLLFSDEGYKGLIISTKGLNSVRVDGNMIIAEAGVSNRTISDLALDNSLEGFEFAEGIPGTIGGGVFMNAGAYGSEMVDVVDYVIFHDGKEIRKFSNEECQFQKRTSIFEKNNGIVLEVGISLKIGDASKIKDLILDYRKRRSDKQPLDKKSAGSTFKRPEGYFAGKLIEDAGLKGLALRDAQISPKHSGFIVNNGNASFKDIKLLMEIAGKVVYDKYGVELEREVRVIE